MPQRLLRPGLKDSASWNACDFQAQSCYIRLLNVVDDYGRYEADPDLLKGHCFAKRHDIDVRAIVSMCQQLSANKLAIFYRDHEKAYLQLLRWKERVRSESRFPDPNADICQQLTAFDSKCLLPTPSPSPSPAGGTPADKPDDPPPPPNAQKPRSKTLRFVPVKAGLYPREYQAMLDAAKAELQKVRNDERSYDRKLTNASADLVALLEREGKQDRIAEVKRRSDAWVRGGLTHEAGELVAAWRDRITEIKASMNGVVAVEAAR